MSASDLFWTEDPLPVTRIKPVGNYDTWKSTPPGERWKLAEPQPETEDSGRCEQCWRDAYGSFPGHVFCREHFLEHQAKVIAEIAAKSQKGAA